MILKNQNRDRFLDIQKISFEMDTGIGSKARIGMIVLASDHIIENEFREIIRIPGVALYQSRIPNSPLISSDSLKAMEDNISKQAMVILPEIKLDVLGYCCTSASVVIGENTVIKTMSDSRPEAKPTTPITAALAAFEALQIKKIGILTPYSNNINVLIRKYIQGQGYQVPAFGSFNEPNDNHVAKISPKSIRNAVIEIGSRDEVEGVFISCTNLRFINEAEAIERRIGKPITSSNQAIIWHSLRLANIQEKIRGYGTLFQKQLRV